MYTFLEEVVGEYMALRGMLNRDTNIPFVYEPKCQFHPRGIVACPHHKGKEKDCLYCVPPDDCKNCLEIEEERKEDRKNYFNTMANMLEPSRKRAMYEVIGQGEGLKIALADLPKVNDAFSPDKKLLKNCEKKARKSDVIEVNDALKAWRTSDASKRGAANLNADFKNAISILVAGYIIVQDGGLTLDDALNFINLALARSEIIAPKKETIRDWLMRLNSIEGTGYQPIKGFSVVKGGCPKGTKHSKVSIRYTT